MNRATNVEMLNAIIGSCKNEPFVPNHLYRLGYTEIAIEKPVAVAEKREVVPDLAIGSPALNGACCFEGKTGRNIESPQARKYAQITPDHIRRYCGFPLDYERDVAVDVGYLCPDDPTCVSGLTYGLDQEKLSFPLLPVGANIALVRGQFKQAELHDVFTTGLPVDYATVPAYYHFDKDSRLYEMAPWVAQSLVSFAQQGNVPFTTADIAADAYGPLWSVTGTRQRDDVIKNTGKILRTAMVKELKAFLEGPDPKRPVKANAKWTLRYANASGTAYPIQRLQRLAKACTDLANRLEREELGTLPGMTRALFGP